MFDDRPVCLYEAVTQLTLQFKVVSVRIKLEPVNPR